METLSKTKKPAPLRNRSQSASCDEDVDKLEGQLTPPLSSTCNRVVRSRLYRTPRQHRGKEPGAFGFQRRDKLEAPERVPSALESTPNPYRWEPRE